MKHVETLSGGPMEEHVSRIRNITLRLINSAVLLRDEACIDPWIWLISCGHLNPLVQYQASSGEGPDVQSYLMVLGTLCSNLLETSRLCSGSAAAATEGIAPESIAPDSVLWKQLMAAHLLLLRILRGGSIAHIHPIATETAKSHSTSANFCLYAHEIITDILSQSELSYFTHFSSPFDLDDLQQLENLALQPSLRSPEDDAVLVTDDGSYLDDMARNLSGIVSSVIGSTSEAAAQVTSKINVLLGLCCPGLFKAGFVLWSLPRLQAPCNGSISVRVIMTAILQDCMLNVAAVATRSVLIVWDKSCSFCTVETQNSEPGFGTWAEGFGGGNIFVCAEFILFTSLKLHQFQCMPGFPESRIRTQYPFQAPAACVRGPCVSPCSMLFSLAMSMLLLSWTTWGKL